MKVFFITLCLVAGAFARSAVQGQGTQALQLPKCPIDDPLIREGPVALNVSYPPIVKLALGSQLTDVNVEGLSTLNAKLDLYNMNIAVTFDIKIPTVTGNATYTAEGYVDAAPLREETLPSGNFSGTGLGKVSATNVVLRGRVSFYTMTGLYLRILRLEIDTISFDSLAIDFGEEFTIAGHKVDWSAINANIKRNFDTDMADHKTAIVEKLQLAGNEYFGKITLLDLVEFFQYDGEPEC